MTAAVRLTAPQLAHLAAAAAGDLFVNGRPGDRFTRPVRVGGRVNRPVVERLDRDGLLVAVEIPGCAAQRRYEPTDAGRAVLAAAAATSERNTA